MLGRVRLQSQLEGQLEWNAASSSLYSAARQPRGLSRRMRSRASGCDASACSCHSPRTIPKRGPGSRRSSRHFKNWAGPKVATCRSILGSRGGDGERIRKYAAELVALTPDVILAAGGTVMAPLQQATRAVPIVFTQTTDPVGAGFVATLARPGGNATGFILFEFGISVKWLELIRDIAPRVTRAAVLRDPTIPSALGQLGAVQGVAPSFGVELILVDVRDVPEIERAVTAFAREANGSLIVLPSASAIVHRDLIITLAARYKLPAVYSARYFVTGGGLISYGPDTIDPHRRAAGYVDRILKGEKPADLPVQAPTKYELVINLKTARALGLDMPATVLARADEVIE
jgi:ABC-type uncharacterized transport system substrate-binding protein